MAGKVNSFEEYIAGLSDEQRAALEKLREIILETVPGAEEVISYQIPGFKLGAKMLVSIGAGARHCSLYLMSSTTVEAHREALQGFETSKGTIRFKPDRPLPDDLVRTLVRSRIAENAEKK